MTPRNIIYLKRDIRFLDNPLFELVQSDGLPFSILYIFEPEIISAGWYDLRHYRFVYHSLLDLNETLSKFGHKVTLYYGSALEVFEWLSEKISVKSVYSHQEVGADVTFRRDKRLRRFFKERQIQWFEIPTDGIMRGLKKRDGWNSAFEEWLNQPVSSARLDPGLAVSLPEDRFVLPSDFVETLRMYPKRFQPAGESEALKVLDSFVKSRYSKYLYSISKPAESQRYSSRLSPYLAYGNISVRVVYQRIKELDKDQGRSRGVEAFKSRLFWRSHFIQKFESMPEYEFSTINKAFDPWPFNYDEALVQAWAEGETGVDLVDAVMKCLKETGWINFRMRAMVVSFLCHALQQPWKAGVDILARYFLDFEPGIHYPQFQMQAGVTGYNTIRIYNPDKQLMDNDPNRTFCDMWLTKQRPKPIVDWIKNINHSKEVLWRIKKSELCKKENERLLSVLR